MAAIEIPVIFRHRDGWTVFPETVQVREVAAAEAPVSVRADVGMQPGRPRRTCDFRALEGRTYHRVHESWGWQPRRLDELAKFRLADARHGSINTHPFSGFDLDALTINRVDPRAGDETDRGSLFYRNSLALSRKQAQRSLFIDGDLWTVGYGPTATIYPKSWSDKVAVLQIEHPEKPLGGITGLIGSFALERIDEGLEAGLQCFDRIVGEPTSYERLIEAGRPPLDSIATLAAAFIARYGVRKLTFSQASREAAIAMANMKLELGRHVPSFKDDRNVVALMDEFPAYMDLLDISEDVSGLAHAAAAMLEVVDTSVIGPSLQRFASLATQRGMVRTAALSRDDELSLAAIGI